jgi:protein gp37
MGDLFHEDIPFDILNEVFQVMLQASNRHIFILLTKRPRRAFDFFAFETDATGEGCSLADNMWLGVTAENQQRADERIPILLQIPAAVRFVSIEPMLGPVDLVRLSLGEHYLNALSGQFSDDPEDWNSSSALDWVIVGGESGPQARQTHPDWVRLVRDDCLGAGVPFFFKQWGEYAPKMFALPHLNVGRNWGTLDIEGNWFPQTTPWNGKQGNDSETREYVMYRVGKKTAGRLLDGRTWDEYPFSSLMGQRKEEY